MDEDTRIGGAAARFPTTRMSVVERARADDESERRRAWETLVRAYWKPIYKHIRLRWRRSNEDAKDLTQEFLASMIDSGMLAAFDPATARLRTYLRSCVDHQVQNHDRAATRIKRGGDVTVLSLDFESAEGELGRIEPVAESDSEKQFEREWIRSLFSIAIEAFEAECVERHGEVDFRIFELYDLADDENGPTYAELAEELGLSVATVTNRLAAARRRFRGLVLATLEEMAGSTEEFRSEARSLLGVEIP